MIKGNQLVLVTMPIDCDCGKRVWCWFKDSTEHSQYKCTCGLKLGEKLIVVPAIIPEEESCCFEY